MNNSIMTNKYIIAREEGITAGLQLFSLQRRVQDLGKLADELKRAGKDIEDELKNAKQMSLKFKITNFENAKREMKRAQKDVNSALNALKKSVDGLSKVTR